MKPNPFLLLLSLIALGFSAYGQHQEPVSGNYYIRSALGRYLDVQWGNPNNGTQMHLWDFNGGAAQKWQIKKDPGGFFTIKSDLGRCLDVPNGKGDMGLMPQLWDCYIGLPQAWMITRMAGDEPWIIQSIAGTVLDVQNANPAAGTPVWMYPFNGSVAQQWYLEPVSARPSAPTPAPAPPAGNVQSNSNTRTFKINLHGIAMGECGSDRDCSHEPVAGFVAASMNYLGNRHPRIGDDGNYNLWRSPEYILRCRSIHYEVSDDEYYARGSYENEWVDPSNDIRHNNVKSQAWTFTIPANANLDAYTVELRFNLGNQHKDNDFAATGDHWLTSQDTSLKYTYTLPFITQSWRHGQEEGYFNIGPFETQSDRCHEYQLVFKVSLR